MTFRHSGDLGDAIYALSVISEIEGKHTLRCVDRPGVTAEFLSRVPLLKKLFESQSYIESVECSEEPVDHDFVKFRRFHGQSTTLTRAMASEIGLIGGTGEKPWLKVKPSKETSGKIVIARSPRYNNMEFPWAEIVRHYGDRLLFVGIPVEHKTFCHCNGRVEYGEVKDFHELAKLIAGSELFIGNQSSPMAVAMGLGHNAIQEVCIEQPDCIYRRDNVLYAISGHIALPDVAGSGELILSPDKLYSNEVNRCIVPPGGWKYDGLPDCDHFAVQKSLVMKLEKCNDSEADNKLLSANAERVDKFFRGTNASKLLAFDTAYKNAFGQRKATPTEEPIKTP